MIERWWFTHPYNGKKIVIDKPQNHEWFHGWITERKKRIPCILWDSKLVFGVKQRITQRATTKCSTGCRRAKPWTNCTCSCGGKNHGIDYVFAEKEIENA